MAVVRKNHFELPSTHVKDAAFPSRGFVRFFPTHDGRRTGSKNRPLLLQVKHYGIMHSLRFFCLLIFVIHLCSIRLCPLKRISGVSRRIGPAGKFRYWSSQSLDGNSGTSGGLVRGGVIDLRTPVFDTHFGRPYSQNGPSRSASYV